MSEVEDLHRYKLPDEVHNTIFRDEIVRDLLTGPVRQQEPVVVFVAGQTGAGKTATTDAIKDAFESRGGAAHVCGDFYKPYHPDYGRLLAEDDRTAGAYTRLDTRQWHADAEQYVLDKRFNAVVETALANPEEFAATAARFRERGYRVEVVAMAVPAAQSRLGIVDRYLRQAEVDGHGRYVDPSNHDNTYAGMVNTAARIDADGLADAVAVVRRGNEKVYTNQLDDQGRWITEPAMAQAITDERNRPWTAPEATNFTERLADVRSRAAAADPRLIDQLDQARDLASPLQPGSSVPSEAVREARESFSRPVRDSAGSARGQAGEQPVQPHRTPGPTDRGHDR